MLIPIPVVGKQKSRDICDAFIAGAPRNAKGYVTYGVNDSNHAEFLAAKATGLPVWQIDNSYFDKTRGLMFRVTKDAVQHSGLGETDGKRFASLGIPVEPLLLIRSSPHVLVVEQSESYMRIHGGEPARKRGRPTAGNETWLTKQTRIHAAGRKIRFRRWGPDKPYLSEKLAYYMQDADLLITHSSAAAVQAYLAGVPVAVSEMSCCYRTPIEDRMRLFGVLADNQFTLREMRDGVAWRALNP